MKKLVTTTLLLLALKQGFSQEEAMSSDIFNCTSFYYYGSDVMKQVRKRQDTLAYFHDKELIVFYNQKETKRLSGNTFYIFNHGFNKLLTFRIVMIEIEASNNKKDKKTFLTTPATYFNVFYQDSLTRCSPMVAGPLQVNIPGYQKSEITALYIEIEYFGERINRWFIKKPAVQKDNIEIQWQKHTAGKIYKFTFIDAVNSISH